MFIAGIKVLTNPSVDADTFAWGIDSTWTHRAASNSSKRLMAARSGLTSTRLVARIRS
jgi:hypothetical protein